MTLKITHAPRFGGLEIIARHNCFLPLSLPAKTDPSDKGETTMTAQTTRPEPALNQDIVLLKHINDPANWGTDRFGRPTIVLEHHRVTLHRVGPQGTDSWTWTCERLDEPGVIRRWVKSYPLAAAWSAVCGQLWADLVDGGTAREDVFRRMAASAEKKQQKTRRPWPPERPSGLSAAKEEP
jgi:hypothetical protein